MKSYSWKVEMVAKLVWADTGGHGDLEDEIPEFPWKNYRHTVAVNAII